LFCPSIYCLELVLPAFNEIIDFNKIWNSYNRNSKSTNSGANRSKMSASS